MKNIFLVLALISSLTSFGQHDASLKITYNGKPVCHYEIILKQGEAPLATGTTDAFGEVNFSQLVLLVNMVDVYARKEGAVDKKFEVKEHVVFDENYHFDLRMEEIIKQITIGTTIPEETYVDSWGFSSLNCK